GRVVADRLEIDGRVAHLGPGGLLHGAEAGVGLEPELEHPIGLALLRGDEADDLLGEAGRRVLLLDLRDEAFFVVPSEDGLDRFPTHGSQPRAPPRAASPRPRLASGGGAPGAN